MLTTYSSMHGLPFEELMAIYQEGNRENGAILAPFDTEARQIQLAERDFYEYLQGTFFKIPGVLYAIWWEGKKAVSALRLEPYRDGLLLEALETEPSQRGKGYGASLICAVQELLASRGFIRLYSHVNKQNQPSLRVHTHCGFQIAADYAVYVDGSVNSQTYTLKFEK